MQLEKALTENRQAVDLELTEFFASWQKKFDSIDPVMGELLANISKQILRSGKRIRPFLITQAYRLAGGSHPELAVKMGMVIELLHQFFLIHDDIADRDEKRYGADSLHISYAKKFAQNFGTGDPHLGLAFGMIGGDVLHTLVYSALADLPVSPQMRERLQNLINETIYNTTAGWQMHFLQNQQPIDKVSPQQYLKGMELVSAKYTFETPLLIGLMLAGGEKWQTALTAYGRHAGMGFQIQDDILGMFGDPKTTGKPVGNDYREGKKTLLVLTAYQKGTTEQKMYLSKTLGTSIDQKQFIQIQTIMRETGALEEAGKMAREEVALAKKALLDTPGASAMAVITLDKVADFVISREA